MRPPISLWLIICENVLTGCLKTRARTATAHMSDVSRDRLKRAEPLICKWEDIQKVNNLLFIVET